ncbi:hypothetical protein T05_13088 [Trichinella murrelli]|uniref:Uncharacterized protein n=1 Tax=Trichinella murrelli TaxID=144512 RepID=A0A0V0U4M2_9BILA|nr:hypothetical protein T05_13088 [Trichinella murrelli]
MAQLHTRRKVELNQDGMFCLLTSSCTHCLMTIFTTSFGRLYTTAQYELQQHIVLLGTVLVPALLIAQKLPYPLKEERYDLCTNLCKGSSFEGELIACMKTELYGHEYDVYNHFELYILYSSVDKVAVQH